MRLTPVPSAQATGLIAHFAGQVGHHRAESGLRVGAAAGLRLFAHDSAPDVSAFREVIPRLKLPPEHRDEIRAISHMPRFSDLAQSIYRP